MGIYYFLLWIGVIGTFLSQDSRLKRTGFYIIFIYILALFVMVVFRYDVGTDYLEYTDYYYRIHSLFELTSEDFLWNLVMCCYPPCCVLLVLHLNSFHLFFFDNSL